VIDPWANSNRDATHGRFQDAGSLAEQPSAVVSKPRPEPRTRKTGKEIIVHERTVQERGVQASALVWPTLTTTNYVEWDGMQWREIRRTYQRTRLR
jgi:hypothetical protein